MSGLRVVHVFFSTVQCVHIHTESLKMLLMVNDSVHTQERNAKNKHCRTRKYVMNCDLNEGAVILVLQRGHVVSL